MRCFNLDQVMDWLTNRVCYPQSHPHSMAKKTGHRCITCLSIIWIRKRNIKLKYYSIRILCLFFYLLFFTIDFRSLLALLDNYHHSCGSVKRRLSSPGMFEYPFQRDECKWMCRASVAEKNTRQNIIYILCVLFRETGSQVAVSSVSQWRLCEPSVRSSKGWFMLDAVPPVQGFARPKLCHHVFYVGHEGSTSCHNAWLHTTEFV